MPYNLLVEKWMPVRTRKGRLLYASVTDLLPGAREDPDDVVVAIAAPRPDLSAALLELLIGILTVALRPADKIVWHRLYRSPPDQAQLQSALDEIAIAFNLDGDGPRFMQDFSPGEVEIGKPEPVNGLLVDAVGEQTEKLNKDLFIKRGRFPAGFSRSTAALVLLVMQTYAPSGGQGHRVSMRGGGPITTLIDPRVSPDADPLWQMLWANVETVEQWQIRNLMHADFELPLIFPWLAPTRGSNEKKGGRATYPVDAHPLLVYFGCPRRIRLSFEARSGECSLSSNWDEVMVTGYWMVNYGSQYLKWIHPMSPHYSDKSGERLPVHGQPGGVGWRDWLSLHFESPGSGKSPAATVANFMDRGRRIGRYGRSRMHVFGYDFDNMKCRGWVESLLPLYALDEDQLKPVMVVAAALTKSVELVAGELNYAIKKGLFPANAIPSGDYGDARQSLWQQTEQIFFEHIDQVIESRPDDMGMTRLLHGFLKPVQRIAMRLFDEQCAVTGREDTTLHRIVGARHHLALVFKGYGKGGSALYASLHLPAPETATKTSRPKGKRNDRTAAA